MGYTTDFTGAFSVTPPLKPEHIAYINLFSETRRMKRRAKLAEALPDPVRVAAGLPIGSEGGYFTGGTGDFGQGQDASIVEYNRSSDEQPGLWCQWVASDDGTTVHWNGGEKFYNYEEWIRYLLHHFFVPWGYVLNGEIVWQGEEDCDKGKLIITDNVVTTKSGHVVYT